MRKWSYDSAHKARRCGHTWCSDCKTSGQRDSAWYLGYNRHVMLQRIRLKGH